MNTTPAPLSIHPDDACPICDPPVPFRSHPTPTQVRVLLLAILEWLERTSPPEALKETA